MLFTYKEMRNTEEIVTFIVAIKCNNEKLYNKCKEFNQLHSVKTIFIGTGSSKNIYLNLKQAIHKYVHISKIV